MKAKKAIAKIISTILLLILAVPAHAIASFQDVPYTAYYIDAVTWGVEQGVASGTTVATFSPNDNCTKAQILSFIWRANGSPEPTINNPFSDLNGSEYYYKAALWSVTQGIGIGDKRFNGDEPCTRSNAMLYMWKTAGQPTPTTKATFSDIQKTNNEEAISWGVENKITSGTSATTFSPDTICTRAQIMSFLYRYHCDEAAANEAAQQELINKFNKLNISEEEVHNLALIIAGEVRVSSSSKAKAGIKPTIWDNEGQFYYYEIGDEDYIEAINKIIKRDSLSNTQIEAIKIYFSKILPQESIDKIQYKPFTQEQMDIIEKELDKIRIPTKDPNSEVIIDPDGTMHYKDIDGNDVTIPPTN